MAGLYKKHSCASQGEQGSEQCSTALSALVTAFRLLPLLSSVMNYNHEGKEISSSQVAFGHGVYHSNRISN